MVLGADRLHGDEEWDELVTCPYCHGTGCVACGEKGCLAESEVDEIEREKWVDLEVTRMKDEEWDERM